MGLLDDAIREHLDLKRRRGADPAEVERAEREALGPVRRSPEPLDVEQELDAPRRGRAATAYDHASSADFHDAGSPAEFGAYDHAADEELGYESEADFDQVEERGEVGRGSAYDYADELDADMEGEEFADEFEAEPETGSFETAPPATRGPAPAFEGEGETAEFDVEHALGREEQGPADENEDVLEETPEFLQDAPEHDRLWFEQRPPRDFDFDR